MRGLGFMYPNPPCPGGVPMRCWLIPTFVFTIFAVELPATHAQTRTAQEIVGSYRCEGTNPNGSRYSGSATIQREDGGYRFHWLIQYNSHYYGHGVRSGNRITVYWGQADPVIYEIGIDGVLRGTWGPGGHGRDTLYPD
jgi:hypothetical protein